MAKDKEVQDVSVFPETTTMNAWGDDGGREFEIEKQRGRTKDEGHTYKKVEHEGSFHIREEWKRYFPGMQLGWIRERCLNQEDPGNLEKMIIKGWKPVKRSECPWLQALDDEGLIPNSGPNDMYRSGGQILMKMPQQMFDDYTLGYEREAAEIERQSAELTGFLGSGHAEPRFKVVDSGSYQPNFVHKRG